MHIRSAASSAVWNISLGLQAREEQRNLHYSIRDTFWTAKQVIGHQLTAVKSKQEADSVIS